MSSYFCDTAKAKAAPSEQLRQDAELESEHDAFWGFKDLIKREETAPDSEHRWQECGTEQGKYALGFDFEHSQSVSQIPTESQLEFFDFSDENQDVLGQSPYNWEAPTNESHDYQLGSPFKQEFPTSSAPVLTPESADYDDNYITNGGDLPETIGYHSESNGNSQLNAGFAQESELFFRPSGNDSYAQPANALCPSSLSPSWGHLENTPFGCNLHQNPQNAEFGPNFATSHLTMAEPEQAIHLGIPRITTPQGFIGDPSMMPSPALSPEKATINNIFGGVHHVPARPAAETVTIKSELIEEPVKSPKVRMLAPRPIIESEASRNARTDQTFDAPIVPFSETDADGEDYVRYDRLTGHELDCGMEGAFMLSDRNSDISNRVFDHATATLELTSKTVEYMKRKQVGRKAKSSSGKDKIDRSLRDMTHKDFRCRFSNCVMSHVGLGRGPLLAAHISASHLETQSLTCYTCNRDFSRSDALRRHRRVVHQDTSSKQENTQQNNAWNKIHSLLTRSAESSMML